MNFPLAAQSCHRKKTLMVLNWCAHKAAQTISNLNTLLVLLKGLPLTYSKDLQDDKKLTFNSYDTVHLGLQVMTELIRKTTFNTKAMKDAIESSHATATDLADWLVQNLQYPFRQAYQITGKNSRLCSKKKCYPSKTIYT